MHYKTITPVATEPVSLATARAHLRIAADQTSEDTLITADIKAARRIAEHFTGRALAPQTIETALDAFPTTEDDTIRLPMSPVATITSVKYADPAFSLTVTTRAHGAPDDGDGSDGDVYWRTDTDQTYLKTAGVWALSAQQPFATISSADYMLSTFGMCDRLTPTYLKYWPTPLDMPDAVRVRAEHGFGATGAEAQPEEIAQAILLMVAWMYEHRGEEMSPDDIQPPAAKALLGTVKDWSR